MITRLFSAAWSCAASRLRSPSARAGGVRREARPADAAFGGVGLHGPARGERVQARALRALDLEELKQPHPLVRRGDQP
jgi:hypothetical protein